MSLKILYLSYKVDRGIYMNKKLSISFLLVLCIFIVSMYYLRVNSDLLETTLVKSFNNSGAKVICSEIYFWGRIGEEYKTQEELVSLLENVSKDMGILNDAGAKAHSAKNDYFSKYEVNGLLPDGQILNMTLTVEKNDSGGKEKVISGTITQDMSNGGIEETSRKIKEVFNSYKVSPKLNTCIVGAFDGRLDDAEMNDIASRVFKEAEAKKVEGMRDEKLISVSAYSPSIGESIKINGRKVNLNLAMRFNNNEDKTYIWLATPVITKEY